MSLESRLASVEEELGINQGRGPFILVVSAGSHDGDPEYEARLRRRIEETRRRHPNDQFRLLLA